MEKSIESIWRDGFLQNEKLVAPKLNSLYNQKSKNIIDKIQRMMVINVWAIVIFSTLILIWWYLTGVLYIGIFMFVLLNFFAFYAKKQMSHIKRIDYGTSSYQYLVSFNQWINSTISNNVKLMRFFYPMMFLAAIATVWYSNDNETMLMQEIIKLAPNIATIGGLPVPIVIGALLIALLMAYFGEKIYRWDVNLVYGRVFKKLEEIIADMEELRKS